jgi:hypothetical protein
LKLDSNSDSYGSYLSFLETDNSNESKKMLISNHCQLENTSLARSFISEIIPENERDSTFIILPNLLLDAKDNQRNIHFLNQN